MDDIEGAIVQPNDTDTHLTLDDLILRLTKYRQEHGNARVVFFSDEWTENMKEKKLQERQLDQMQMTGRLWPTLSIYLST